ncbi:MAG: hypothetical protein HDT37_01835 [Clostridiales bacterium]|nr:hypothetical protein [Clostridiales bacterium]
MKHMRRFTALVLALVMVFSLTVSASAAPAPETIQVNINYSMSVAYNGKIQSMKDTNGNRVYPILNGGTTYLPVRAVSNMLGLDVKWDQATQTVILSDPADGQKSTGQSFGSFLMPEAKPDLEAVTVSLNPGITVTYNGEVQTLKDTNGNTVYPMLYGGTTYLPVRAVGNMLGLAVDWNQSMQTVLLGEPDYDAKYGEYDEGFFARFTDGQMFTLGGYLMYMSEKGAGQDEIDAALADVQISKEAEAKFTSGEWHDYWPEDYIELDTSTATANEGYIRFKWTKLVSDGVIVNVVFGGKSYNFSKGFNEQMLDTWQTIPLSKGSGRYDFTIGPIYDITKNALEKYEKYECRGNTLIGYVTADMADPDAVFLISNLYVDYENSPNAVAKAKELTKDCKTEAEKITAIYNFVSGALTYDHALYNADKAAQKTHHDASARQAARDLNPDHILASGKGVCEHYAILMAAMLRSVGVPCKMVSGESHFNGEWEGHAWVAVNPKTGTLNISGAGKDYASYDETGKPTDPTGWIRLDPTNAHVPNTASNDSLYHTDYYY